MLFESGLLFLKFSVGVHLFVTACRLCKTACFKGMMAVNFKDHLLIEKFFINLTLLLSLFIIHGYAAKLTVPRILLPYNTGVPTNYTLEVKEGGCYKWYTI